MILVGIFWCLIHLTLYLVGVASRDRKNAWIATTMIWIVIGMYLFRHGGR